MSIQNLFIFRQEDLLYPMEELRTLSTRDLDHAITYTTELRPMSELNFKERRTVFYLAHLRNLRKKKLARMNRELLSRVQRRREKNKKIVKEKNNK